MALSRSAIKASAAKVSRRSSVVVRASDESVAYAKSLPGISAPFAGMFDPFNLAASATVKEVRRFRESELTHGRVAMLAALGFVIGEQLEDFPAFVNFDGHIVGPAINQFQQVNSGFWEPLVGVIGLCEAYRVGLGWESPKGLGFNTLKDDYVMGDLGFDPLGLKPVEDAALFELQTKELNNGRLAMIAVAGFVAQELVDQQEIFEHLFVDVKEDAIQEIVNIETDVANVL